MDEQKKQQDSKPKKLHVISYALNVIMLAIIVVMAVMLSSKPDVQTPEDNPGKTPGNVERPGEDEPKPPVDPDHVHMYGDWTVAQEANCSAPGVRERVCSCGDKVTQEIPINGQHVYADNVVPPTKTEDGYTEHSCQFCDNKYTDEITHATGSVGLAYTVNSDGKTCTITGIGTATDKELYIPAYIDGYKVTTLGAKAFEDNKTITKVVLPDTITTIERRVFMSCSELTEINIPKNVSSISTQILDNCDKLTTLYYYTSKEFSDFKLADIPSIKKVLFSGSKLGDLFRGNETIEEVVLENSVNSLNNSAFSSCKGLKKIVLSENITSIPDDTFYNCKLLEYVDISENVISIGESAFYGCESLTSITIPDSVTSIPEYAFGSCTGLTSIVIPDSVTTIMDSAFSNCIKLTGVIIPDSVTSIGQSAFYRCESLTDIEIPDSVKYIGGRAFRECIALKNILLSNSVTTLHYGTFYGCTSLVQITLPENLLQLGLLDETFGEGVFVGCTNLTNVIFNDKLESVGENCFEGCVNLKSVTLNKGLKTIGPYAFMGCTGLIEIYIPDSVTQILGSFKELSSFSISVDGNLDEWKSQWGSRAYSSFNGYFLNMIPADELFDKFRNGWYLYSELS